MNRKTKQHEAIRRTIAEAGRPLSSTEILEGAQREVPGLGLATVYRALKRLVEEGLAATVALPGEPPRYESGAAASTHHHHFHCQGCGRVYDVAGCPGDMARITPPGFELNGHELVLYGRCADCSAVPTGE